MICRGSRWASRSRYRSLGVLAITLWLSVLTSVPTFASPTEAQMRAAVIVAIMRFTAWPGLPVVEDDLQVCLLGQPRSTEHLLPISGQQRVAGRLMQVRHINGVYGDGSHINGPSVDACQVLVLGNRELDHHRAAQLLQLADRRGMLSICDGCRRDYRDQTIVQLILRQQKINFEVNLSNAQRSGVHLDAQVLELASAVRR